MTTTTEVKPHTVYAPRRLKAGCGQEYLPHYNKRLRGTSGLPFWCVMIGLASVLGFTIATLTSGRLALAIASIATLGTVYLIYRSVACLLPNLIIPRAIILTYASQAGALLVLAIFGVSTKPAEQHTYVLDLADSPVLVCASQLTLFFGTLLAVMCLHRLASSQAHRLTTSLYEGAPRNLNVCLIIASVLLQARWLLTAEVLQPVRYPMQVAANALAFVPFLAGWFYWEIPWASRVSFLMTLAGAAVGCLMGSRNGLVLLGLYAIGWCLSPHGRRIRKAAIVASLAVPAIYLSGLVGIVRTSTGRDSLELLKSDNISKFFEVAGTEMYTDISTVAGNGLTRFVAWPNFAAVVLTPDTIGYRELSSVLPELRMYMHVWGNSEGSKANFLEQQLGTMPSNAYGFTVNNNTSVDFGVLADGWSRAGAPGATLFAFVIALVLIGSELLFSNNRRVFDGATRLIAICILANITTWLMIFPTLFLIRSTILYCVAFAVVAAIAAPMLRRKN